MNPALAALGIGALVIGLVVLALPPQRQESDSFSLQVVGSETVRPLVTACAESFMASDPSADVIVRGGGSGDGIASLLHGIADIGMVSRPLTPKEREFASSKAELTGQQPCEMRELDAAKPPIPDRSDTSALRHFGTSALRLTGCSCTSRHGRPVDQVAAAEGASTLVMHMAAGIGARLID
jgi:PBP superfamily domain